MKECGYRLRCFNYGKKCSECKYLNKNKKKDCLVDILAQKEKDSSSFIVLF